MLQSVAFSEPGPGLNLMKDMLLSRGLDSVGATFVVVLAATSIVVGLGLYHDKRWARVMAKLIALLYSGGGQVGLIVATYTWWALNPNRALLPEKQKTAHLPPSRFESHNTLCRQPKSENPSPLPSRNYDKGAAFRVLWGVALFAATVLHFWHFAAFHFNVPRLVAATMLGGLVFFGTGIAALILWALVRKPNAAMFTWSVVLLAVLALDSFGAWGSKLGLIQSSGPPARSSVNVGSPSGSGSAETENAPPIDDLLDFEPLPAPRLGSPALDASGLKISDVRRPLAYFSPETVEIAVSNAGTEIVKELIVGYYRKSGGSCSGDLGSYDGFKKFRVYLPPGDSVTVEGKFSAQARSWCIISAR